MKDIKQKDRLFWGLMAVAIGVLLIILGQNVYNSLYPPLFFPQKIDVTEVKKRIKAAGLVPMEASHYEAIELDTRLRSTDEEKVEHGQD